MNGQKLNLLILEDNPNDAELMVKELENAGFVFKWKRVETEKAFKKGLAEKPDIVLSDYNLPLFDGMAAIKLHGQIAPEIPLILVSGSIGEELAIECLKAGATDYVLKDRLPRLGPVVKRALKEAEEHRELKQVADALRKSEEKFRLIAENASDVITLQTFDLKASYSYVSPSMKALTGYEPEEVLGKSAFDFVHPEDKKALFPLLKKYVGYKLKNLITGKEPDFRETIELRIKGKSGRWIYVQSTANTMGNQLLFVTRDITERKQAEKALRESEQKYRQLAETAKDVIIVMDLKGNIEYINKEGIDLCGYDKEEIFKMNVKKVLPADKIPLSDENFARRIAGDKSLFMYEIDFFNKKGDSVPVEVKSSLITDQGKPSGVLIIARDITERKRAEQKLQKQNEEYASLNEEYKATNDYLRKARDRAEESDRLKTAFLQNISHEIRTPMNGILGFTSLLKTYDVSLKEQQSYVNLIMASGKRMLNTLDDLMDISKLETGQVKLKFSRINVNDELKNLYDFFRPEVEGKGMQFNFTVPSPTKGIVVNTDRVKLYAILANLIKNSIKYSHKGSIGLGYDLKVDNGSAELVFYVKDTGIGIPKDRQNAIFDRFVQADIADVKVYEGAGLGLSISKAYVEMLGGKIWVESEVGVGSQFCFTIPYSPDNKETSTPQIETDTQTETPIKKLKVLIAEDEEIADTYLTLIIKKFSTHTFHTKTGTETIELCRQNPDIDLILMDIKMPVMDGYEAARKIREFNKDVIIIAQTAYALEGDRKNAIRAGCDDYISKPINKNKLLEMIGKWFQV